VENVSANFDLDARTIVALPPEGVARLQAHLVRP
jgi:hypothetical protein